MRPLLASLLLAFSAPAAAERPPSVLAGWAFTMAVLDASSEACGANVAGAHVAGGGVLVGPALRAPDPSPPRPPGAGTFEVRRIYVGRADSMQLQVDLMLGLHAQDPVSATLMLEDLLARLAAQPELREPVRRPTTWPLPEEQGLLTSRFSFLIDLSGRARGEVPAAASFHSIELAARTLAARAQSRVPHLRYGPGAWGADGADEFRMIDLRPAFEDALVGAAHLHHFLVDLEACAPGLTCGYLLLETTTPDAGQRLADGWRWSSRMEHRRSTLPGVARPWPSALEGLHLVLGVMAAFEREGVTLDGFVPATTYGPRTKRELGLPDRDLAALATRAGYAIHLLGFDVGSGEQGDLSLDLDLMFDHPAGAIESTRLFELFSAALLAQPEVSGVERLAAQALSPGTAVAVEDLDLQLRSVWAERPDRPPRRTGALTYLRSTAARDGVGIGELEIGLNEQQGGVITYSVVPEQSVTGVQGLYDFLWSVENDEAGYTAVRIRTARARRSLPNTPRGWTFDARIRAEPER